MRHLLHLVVIAIATTACADGVVSGGEDGGDLDSTEDTGGDDQRPPPTRLDVGYTEYLGKLTGSTRNPTAPVGFSGTDLGVAFARDGQLAFLFGDAWGDNRDQMALASLEPPGDDPPAISWVTGADGLFQGLLVPGVDTGAFNVPLDAVPVGERTYYFFNTGYDFGINRHSHLVLAHGTGLAIDQLVLDWMEPSDKFLNVSIVVDGGEAWIFGSGWYRASPLYLARVELERIADRSAWRYAPDFVEGAGEAAAAPVVADACFGEISVRRHPATGLWLLAAACGSPRGAHLRTATSPTGPWSDPMLIYTPELGYQSFLHADETFVGHDDGLSDPGREAEWGGEYAPYLIPDWFTSPAPGVHALVYTFSSWNPYQVHLLRTIVVEPGVAVDPPRPGEGLPPAQLTNGDFAGGSLAGWSSSGGPFFTFQRPDGAWRVTSYGPAGDATTGELWQDFVVDAGTSALSFRLHGGDAVVELRRGDEVVRRSRGRRDNDSELAVRWRLDHLRGEKLHLVIVDDLTGPWGFIGAGDFQLLR